MRKCPIFTSILVVLFLNYSVLATPAADEITFTQIASPVTSDINAVTWVTNDICMAVTADGKILKSEDAGLTWTAAESGKAKSLNDIGFYDETTGVIAGGDENFSANNTVLMRTSDGGLTWVDVGTAFNYEPLYAVGFARELGEESLHKAFFDPTMFTSGPLGLLYKLAMVFLNSGGSAEYADIALSGISNTPFFFLLFVGLLGYLMGGDGKIVKTADGGMTFEHNQATDKKLNGGYSPNQSGSALYKNDVNSLGKRILSKTSAIGPIAAIGDEGTFIGSIDEGDTWTPRVSGTLENINGMSGIGSDDTAQFWYVADNGGIFMKTGLDGEPVDHSVSTTNFKDIAISDAGVAIVVGEGGAIYRAQLEAVAAPPVAPTDLVGTYIPGPPVDVVALNWADNSTNEDGFYIWRQSPSDQNVILIDSVEADVTAYSDSSITESGTYTYLVSAYNGEGETVITTPYEVAIDLTDVEETPLPAGYTLHQNYPNPFNPTTVISFRVAKTSNVKLEVYDMIGTKISTLLNERLRAGNHSLTFDASNLTSGIYFYRLITPEYQSTQKMSLIK